MFTYYANTVYFQNPPYLFTLEPKLLGLAHAKYCATLLMPRSKWCAASIEYSGDTFVPYKEVGDTFMPYM